MRFELQILWGLAVAHVRRRHLWSVLDLIFSDPVWAVLQLINLAYACRKLIVEVANPRAFFTNWRSLMLVAGIVFLTWYTWGKLRKVVQAWKKLRTDVVQEVLDE